MPKFLQVGQVVSGRYTIVKNVAWDFEAKVTKIEAGRFPGVSCAHLSPAPAGVAVPFVVFLANGRVCDDRFEFRSRAQELVLELAEAGEENLEAFAYDVAGEPRDVVEEFLPLVSESVRDAVLDAVNERFLDATVDHDGFAARCEAEGGNRG